MLLGDSVRECETVDYLLMMSSCDTLRSNSVSYIMVHARVVLQAKQSMLRNSLACETSARSNAFKISE